MAKEAPVIPGYLVLRPIGRGGMGEVWLAKQEETGVPVAIKVMRPHGSEKYRRLAEREAVASLNLQHENIVATLAIGRLEGRTWMAMQYAAGGSLQLRVQKRGTIDEAGAVQIALGAARGLREAARAGVVHRDVKPSNLLLDTDGKALVCDLGLVTESGEDASGLRMGTPRYMAPEQLTVDGSVDQRSDIYSLGLTLYFAVTGKHAVEGEDAGEIVRRQGSRPLPDPREHAPELTNGFVNVLRRMTEKKPADRYRLWDELIIDLEHVARGDRPLSAAIAVAKRAAVRRRWIVPVAVVLAGLLLAGAVVVANLGGDPGPVDVGPTVDPVEAEARGRLVFIDEQVSKGLAEETAVGRYRDLVTRYPGTEAARQAAERADGIEARREAEYAEVRATVEREVQTLIAKGEFEAAHTVVEEARAILFDADRERIRKVLEDRAGEIARTVSSAFDRQFAAGDFAAARETIRAAPETGLAGLSEWRVKARQRLTDAERKVAEDARAAARGRYGKVLTDVLRAAAAGRATEARRMLDMAAGREGVLLGDRPEIDRRILSHVAAARKRVEAGAKDRIGNPLALVVDGELLVGRLESTTPEGLRLAGTDTVLSLDRMDDETIRFLSDGGTAQRLSAFALARGDAREATLHLAGVDTPLAERIRALARLLPPRPAPPEKPGRREGETPAAAADRLAAEGHVVEAYGLDKTIVGRFPSRNRAAARDLSSRGLDLFVTGRVDEATALFVKAAEKDPFDGDLRLHLARALLDLAAGNRSPVLLDRIDGHLRAGEAFRPGLDETKRLRERLRLLRG